jgi:hypothetical protein
MLPYWVLADGEWKLCAAFGIIIGENVHGKNGFGR